MTRAGTERSNLHCVAARARSDRLPLVLAPERTGQGLASARYTCSATCARMLRANGRIGRAREREGLVRGSGPGAREDVAERQLLRASEDVGRGRGGPPRLYSALPLSGHSRRARRPRARGQGHGRWAGTRTRTKACKLRSDQRHARTHGCVEQRRALFAPQPKSHCPGAAVPVDAARCCRKGRAELDGAIAWLAR